MGIKKHTTYTWESPDGEILPIPFEFSQDGSELFRMSDDGLSCILGVLDQDQDPEDPFDGDEGEFYQFNRHYYHCTAHPDIEDWKRIVRANPGRVFTHDGTGDCHGPGTTYCRVDSIVMPRDCRGDKRTGENSRAEELLDEAGGYYIVPEDATDPRSYADSALETYSQWCNGDVYGVCIWSYTRDFAEYDLDGNGVPGEFTDWEEPEREECWGFFGYDYAEKELQEQFDATDFIKPAPATTSKQGELNL